MSGNICASFAVRGAAERLGKAYAALMAAFQTLYFGLGVALGNVDGGNLPVIDPGPEGDCLSSWCHKTWYW
jgi:hypothetical protein